MIRRLAVLAAVLALPALTPALDAGLKRIHDSKTIRIAYRADAIPFSFQQDGQPAGYTVDLCKRVVTSLERQLKVQPLAVKWVVATTENRLDLVRKGEVDLECGATTVTLSRMEQVDFSSPVFVDTTSLLARKSAGAKSLSSLGGKKIAVVVGTTNQRALEKALKDRLVSATVVPVKSREEGVAALEGGTADAMAGDRLLLAGLATAVKDAAQYELLDDDLSLEPLAIVLSRNDASLRLAVNRALAQIFAGDAIVEVFRQTFGAAAKPPPALLVVYALGAYAE